MSKKFKWTYRLLIYKYRVAAPITLYLIVLGIIISLLNRLEYFDIPKINKSKKPRIVMLKMDLLTFWY